MKRTAIALVSLLAVMAPWGIAEAAECNVFQGVSVGCLSAGAEATLLYPSRSAPVIALTPAAGDSFSSADFIPPIGAGGRIWLGYDIYHGWGIRARLWDYDDNKNFASFPAPGSPLNFANGTDAIHAYATDFEATKDVRLGSLFLEGAFGGRYARLQQNQALDVASTGVTETATAARDIRGTGVTGFFEARYMLGNSNVGLFANVRDSAVWGSDFGAVTGTINASRGLLENSTGNTLSILETQIGAEWDPPLACSCGTMFVRAAYEFQRWSAGNNLDIVLTGVPGFSARPENANIQFSGFTFAVGVHH